MPPFVFSLISIDHWRGYGGVFTYILRTYVFLQYFFKIKFAGAQFYRVLNNSLSSFYYNID